jgi:hypothetical protein
VRELINEDGRPFADEIQAPCQQEVPSGERALELAVGASLRSHEHMFARGSAGRRGAFHVGSRRPAAQLAPARLCGPAVGAPLRPLRPARLSPLGGHRDRRERASSAVRTTP